MSPFAKAVFKAKLRSLLAARAEAFISFSEIFWSLQLDKTRGKQLSDGRMMPGRGQVCSLWRAEP